MQLLVVRHGRPETIAGTHAGVADPALEKAGLVQASAVARALQAGTFGPVAGLVSSPMRRARETAAPSVAALGLELTVEPGLAELDDGAAAYGNGFDDHDSRSAAWDAINEGHWLGHRFDPRAFASRVVDGMETVIDRFAALHGRPEANLAVFCHAGVISAFVGHVVRAERPLFMAPDYGSVSRILVEPDGHREVLSINQTGHLGHHLGQPSSTSTGRTPITA